MKNTVMTFDEITLGQEWDALEQARCAQADADRLVEAALKSLVSKAGNTFRYNGQVYQIRTRLNKTTGLEVTYLTSLVREPKDFRRGPRHAAVTALPAPVDSPREDETITVEVAPFPSPESNTGDTEVFVIPDELLSIE